MAKPVISSITKDSARITGKAPSSGSAITRYNLLLTLDAEMTRFYRDTTGTSPVFDAGNLPPNQTFWVWMRAQNSAGWGPWSSSTVFTTIASGPAAPTVVTVASESDTQHNISWQRNPTPNSPYTTQSVQRKTDNHQTINDIRLKETLETDRLAIVVEHPSSEVAAALFQIHIEA
jgi:hypothetical protein